MLTSGLSLEEGTIAKLIKLSSGRQLVKEKDNSWIQTAEKTIGNHSITSNKTGNENSVYSKESQLPKFLKNMAFSHKEYTENIG